MGIEKLVVIGVGLIGGSLSLALKKAGYVKVVVGVGRSQENLDDALSLRIVDKVSQDIGNAVKDAGVVVIAVPVGSIGLVCKAISEHLPPTAVVTDVGSTKQSVLDQVQSVFGYIPDWFIPGHPVAGTESSGAKSAFPELFINRKVVLTPLQSTNKAALATIRAMWEETGAVVEEMSVREHDSVLSASSHLPHVLAFALVDYLASAELSDSIFHYAAGGFEDFTRIASSDPRMWTDICLGNNEAIVESLTGYQKKLQALSQHIKELNEPEIYKLFSHAKKTRDTYNDK